MFFFCISSPNSVQDSREQLVKYHVTLGRIVARTHHSIVFARWFQCASPCITVSSAHRESAPTGISIGLSVFARLAGVPSRRTNTQTDRQTDRHTEHETCDACSNKPHLCDARNAAEKRQKKTIYFNHGIG